MLLMECSIATVWLYQGWSRDPMHSNAIVQRIGSDICLLTIVLLCLRPLPIELSGNSRPFILSRKSGRIMRLMLQEYMLAFPLPCSVNVNIMYWIIRIFQLCFFKTLGITFWFRYIYINHFVWPFMSKYFKAWLFCSWLGFYNTPAAQ